MQKIQRNDLCWCGSKIKYKKCHMKEDERLTSFKNEGYPIPQKNIIRTQSELERIKKACNLTHDILIQLNNIIDIGITTNEINDWVHQETLKAGAAPAPLNYKGFPKSICTSINEVICHGIPSNRALKNGDLLNVDVTCILDGCYGDSCRMYEVGQVSPENKRLSEVAKECLDLAINVVKPWTSISVIGDAIETHAKKNGYSVVDMFGGHGIGLKFHEEPFIYHCKRKEKQMIMVPNMVFTIEPMINIGTHKAKILKDNWTAVTKDGKASAQWEHTVCVTDTGVEILT
eukprot:COSAG01_NODE_14_length_41020_cov_40.702133_38_plen_288_part_00